MKCFFENFENAERNSLHAKYRRRAMVAYFNTLIEGCRLGQNSEEQKTVREAIISILRYHEQSRSKNSGVCMMGKYHNVLYVALKICYDWQLQDTETVAALLDEIYACERTFERLFVGALFGTNAPHFIAGWKSDFDNQEENLRAMVFFLDHATNAACEYDNQVRFIDVSIESCGKMSPLKIAVQLGLPDKVHILLRFGALVDLNDHQHQDTMIEGILKKLNEFDHSYPYNLVSCLQFLLRVVPSINCNNFNKHKQESTPFEGVMQQFPNLVQDCILPMNRCGLQPPELKHLARCAVRSQLWLNCQLPNGIRTLPIPETLQKYIDILED